MEDVKQYFLYCPMYAAHRIALFTSAAYLLGDKWLQALVKKKIACFLLGSISVKCSYIPASSVIYFPFISFFLV